METLRKNKFVALVLIICLLIASGSISITVYAATHPSWTTTIETGSMVDTASYVIFKDGSTIYAKNGTTGAIDYSGSNTSFVIYEAIENSPEGGMILIKAGQYDLTNEILITKPIRICGELGLPTERYDGVQVVWSTRINVLNNDGIGFHIKSKDAVIIEDLLLFNVGENYLPSHQSKGIFVEGYNTTTWNTHSRFQRLRIVGFHYGIHLKAAGAIVIDGCYIALCRYGLYNQNTVNGDVGDNTIVNSVISGNWTWGYDIYMDSGGGLRIINNKIFYGAYGIYVNITAETSNLLIEGNSIENQVIEGIYISSSTLFYNIIIDGNQFGGLSLGVNNYIYLDGDIQSILISDNIIRGSIISHRGIYVNGGTFILINGNSFAYLAYGVYLAGGSQRAVINNVFKGVTTAIQGAPENATNNYEYTG